MRWCLSWQVTNDSAAPTLRWAPEWPQRGHCHHQSQSRMFSTKQMKSLRYVISGNTLKSLSHEQVTKQAGAPFRQFPARLVRQKT